MLVTQLQGCAVLISCLLDKIRLFTKKLFYELFKNKTCLAYLRKNVNRQLSVN